MGKVEWPREPLSDRHRLTALESDNDLARSNSREQSWYCPWNDFLHVHIEEFLLHGIGMAYRHECAGRNDVLGDLFHLKLSTL